MAHFVRDTLSQVKLGSALLEAWQDSDIAAGRVLSSLLFNVFVDGLARAVYDAAPGVSLASSTQITW